ncbi:MAG: Ig-like domain-containing protein, partial [Planctomycetota bacterium]
SSDLVYDISDEEQPYEFERRFESSGRPGPLALAGGQIYSTTSESRLEVIRYVERERGNQAPTVSLEVLGTSSDDPLQAERGSILTAVVNAVDNSQVTRVRVTAGDFLDTTVSSFPFQATFRVPYDASRDSFSLAAEALDAAGNIGRGELTINIVADTTLPKVLAVSPTAGTSSLLPKVTAHFDEPIDLVSVPGQFRLFGAGPDTEIGTADDVEVTDLSFELENGGRSVVAVLSQSLTEGNYLGRLGANLQDSSGNALGLEREWKFFVGAEGSLAALPVGGSVLGDFEKDDVWTLLLPLESGNTYVLDLGPDPSRQSTGDVSIRNPDASIRATDSFQESEGFLHSIKADVSGIYAIVISSADGAGRFLAHLLEARPLDVDTSNAATFETRGEVQRWVFEADAGELCSLAIIAESKLGRIRIRCLDERRAQVFDQTRGTYAASETFRADRGGTYLLSAEPIDDETVAPYAAARSRIPTPIAIPPEGGEFSGRFELGSERPTFSVMLEPTMPLGFSLETDDGLSCYVRVRLPSKAPFYERPYRRGGVVPDWALTSQANPTGTRKPLRLDGPGEYVFELQPTGLASPVGNYTMRFFRAQATDLSIDDQYGPTIQHDPYGFSLTSVNAPAGQAFLVHTDFASTTGLRTAIYSTTGELLTESNVNAAGNSLWTSTGTVVVPNDGCLVEQSWSGGSGSSRFKLVPIAPPFDVAIPGGTGGTIDTLGERHYFRIRVQAGDRVRLDFESFVEEKIPEYGLWGTVTVREEGSSPFSAGGQVARRFFRSGELTFGWSVSRDQSYIIEVDGDSPVRSHETGRYGLSVNLE